MKTRSRLSGLFGFLAIISSFVSTPVFATSLSTLHNSGFAVVLIDMQQGFFERGNTTNTPELKNLIDHQVVLLDWAVKNEIPVLIFEYDTFGETDPRLIAAVQGHAFAQITKYDDNGFGYESNEAAVSQLKEWHVDSLIVAGINGEYCVKSTVFGAMQEGFDVMTSSDIVGNINENPPIYPNATWFFKGKKFVVFENLNSIIN